MKSLEEANKWKSEVEGLQEQLKQADNKKTKAKVGDLCDRKPNLTLASAQAEKKLLAAQRKYDLANADMIEKEKESTVNQKMVNTKEALRRAGC